MKARWWSVNTDDIFKGNPQSGSHFYVASINRKLGWRVDNSGNRKDNRSRRVEPLALRSDGGYAKRRSTFQLSPVVLDLDQSRFRGMHLPSPGLVLDFGSQEMILVCGDLERVVIQRKVLS